MFESKMRKLTAFLRKQLASTCKTSSHPLRLLVMKVTYLRQLCKSCFALVIQTSSWVDLAKMSGFSYQKEGKETGRWILRKSKESRRCEWKPTSDTSERQKDLRDFMKTLQGWPSVGVLLESARIFGAPSLQPAPSKRSRLAALYCILQEITEEGIFEDAELEEFEELEELEELEDSDTETEEATWTTRSTHSGSKSTKSTMFPGMDWHLFPPPICYNGEENFWPAPRTAEHMVHLLSQECDNKKAAGTVVRGRRVLTRTRPYARLCTMLNRLRYKESKLVNGSWITEASKATALLIYAGYAEDVVEEWVGGNSIPSDLLIAMIVAKWRRFNQGRSEAQHCESHMSWVS